MNKFLFALTLSVLALCLSERSAFAAAHTECPAAPDVSGGQNIEVNKNSFTVSHSGKEISSTFDRAILHPNHGYALCVYTGINFPELQLKIDKHCTSGTKIAFHSKKDKCHSKDFPCTLTCVSKE